MVELALREAGVDVPVRLFGLPLAFFEHRKRDAVPYRTSMNIGSPAKKKMKKDEVESLEFHPLRTT